MTNAGARLSFEQEILVASDDPGINNALATEIIGGDVERARYAVFLLCLRARFVPHTDFLIKQVNGLVSSGSREGRIAPFPPDFSKLDQRARAALQSALSSPNQGLRSSARIYSFAALEDLSSVPTNTLAKQWRAAAGKVPACFHDHPLAYSDAEQSISLIKSALASRGLAGVVAISPMLKNENDTEARGEEIEFVRFVDTSVVRLRGSEEGTRVIQILKEAVLAHPLRYCWMRFNQTEGDRQKYWLELEDQFLRDRVPCDLGSWATLIALALDQLRGDSLTKPALFEKDYRVCSPQMQRFISWLTDVDPNFPAWEFPSTGTQDDMLHPLFLSKIGRYHEMWVKMNAVR